MSKIASANSYYSGLLKEVAKSTLTASISLLKRSYVRLVTSTEPSHALAANSVHSMLLLAASYQRQIEGYCRATHYGKTSSMADEVAGKLLSLNSFYQVASGYYGKCSGESAVLDSATNEVSSRLEELTQKYHVPLPKK